MQPSHPKPSSPNYSGVAWWIVPLALLIGFLLLVFGNADNDSAQPVVLARPSPDTELVSIGAASLSADSTANPATQFAPPDELLHQRTVEKLRRFRTDFRQMAPAIAVSTLPGSKTRAKLAEALSNMLASEQLSGHVEASPAGILANKNMQADVLLYTREANREIVFRFLTAISPYLSGRILLVYNEDYTLDRLLLVIRGEPRFAPNGAVTFADD